MPPINHVKAPVYTNDHAEVIGAGAGWYGGMSDTFLNPYFYQVMSDTPDCGLLIYL